MPHIIQNFDDLAITNQRRQLLTIAEAGFQASDSKGLTLKALSLSHDKNTLQVNGKTFDLNNYNRIICVGIGKAALKSAEAIYQILDGKISCGFVLDVREGQVGNLTCRTGSHPHPTVVNISATTELLSLLKGLTEKDLVLMTISGGGSSLLCMPHEISCEGEVNIIKTLMHSGSSIQEINTVRKHISKVKGGSLAKWCYPATIVSLIISDVVGDDISFVASGPTVMDKTTIHDAEDVLRKYKTLELCHMSSCSLVETPKDEKYFENVHNFLIGSMESVKTAMFQKARDLGLTVVTYPNKLSGEARESASQIIQFAKNIQCVVAVGETTVRVVGSGLGGRNQEMALSALLELPEQAVFGSFATDGFDNSDSAGAIADSLVMENSKSQHIDPQEYLNNNDSYTFFKKTSGQVHTGKTGANLADFAIYLKY